jgi:hypothetical protein
MALAGAAQFIIWVYGYHMLHYPGDGPTELEP